METECILCGNKVKLSKVLGKAEYSVECKTCGDFVFDDFFKTSYTSMPSYKRAMISAYTRECFERGNNIPILADPSNIIEIIENYEKKTMDKKLDNLILYLKRKSKHFGDAVSWDENFDYPITYSPNPREFSKIREIATKKRRLVDFKARGVGLELTDIGWEKGEELEEKIRMEFKSKIDSFLRKLWESTDGDEHEVRDKWEIGKELGYSNTDTRKISQYLKGEGYLRDRSDQNDISITHEGIKAADKKKQIKGNNEESKVDPKKVFVVHGRNIKAKDAIFDLLRSVHLEPIEWAEAIKMTGKSSPYPQEVLDAAFKHAQSIVVLITGDDLARLRREYIIPKDQDFEKNLTPQARPNVIFEAGLAFGRNPDRTILVELENEETRPFSDVQGRLVVRLSNEPTSRHALISRLKTAGCKIDINDKSDWIKKGDFDAAIPDKSEIEEISKSKQDKKDDQKTDLNKEHFWILTEIASDKFQALDDNILFSNFIKEFQTKKRIDFNIIMNDLEQWKLARPGSSPIGDSVFWMILNKGLQLLKQKRESTE